jgi:putative transposase
VIGKSEEKVMPNHVQCIVVLNGMFDTTNRATTRGRPYGVSEVIGWFKTMTTNHYIHGVKQQDWESFLGKLWQRSFHDHIIRTEKECNTLREYILINPARWESDTFYTPS